MKSEDRNIFIEEGLFLFDFRVFTLSGNEING